MSERIGNIVIIKPEPPQQCDMCGKIDELRPYGIDGACICRNCGSSSPEMKKIVVRNMGRILFGIDEEPTEELIRLTMR